MKAIQSNENLAYLKLNVLFLSTLNVRTVSASKEDDKQLKASINALGILQSLTVVKEGEKFGVIGGGRRLEQLRHLAEEGEIATDYLVPCLIKNIDNSSISAMSLSENIKAKMHPADEFIAFERMVNEGKTIASIAHEFGITQMLVKKRLKMATVAPTLIDAYREGKIDLENIIAFTVLCGAPHNTVYV